MCCHCTSKNSLLQTQVSLRYMKHHFFVVKVYRNILLEFFICKSCHDKMEGKKKQLNRNASILTFTSIIFILLMLLIAPILGIHSAFISISISIILILSFVTGLILCITNLTDDPKISFLPPLRIIFPNKVYTSFFESVNPDLKL